MFIEGKIMIVLSIPMIRPEEQFEMFRALSVPIIYPKPLYHVQQEKAVDLSAIYILESNGFLIDKARQKYVLLTDLELDTCSQNEVKLCGIQSPIYTVVKSKSCIINLFTKTVSKQHCLTSVTMENFIIAYHLGWIYISI